MDFLSTKQSIWGYRHLCKPPYIYIYSIIYSTNIIFTYLPFLLILHYNHYLLGGLEHDFQFSIYWEFHGISSSQLTKSIIFQRGWLNHQVILRLNAFGASLRWRPLPGLIGGRCWILIMGLMGLTKRGIYIYIQLYGIDMGYTWV